MKHLLDRYYFGIAAVIIFGLLLVQHIHNYREYYSVVTSAEPGIVRSVSEIGRRPTRFAYSIQNDGGDIKVISCRYSAHRLSIEDNVVVQHRMPLASTIAQCLGRSDGVAAYLFAAFLIAIPAFALAVNHKPKD